MELRRLLVIVRRRLLLLTVIVVAGLAAAFLGTSRTPVYQATSTIYVGPGSTTLVPSAQAAQAVLAGTFAPIVSTPAVVGAAVASAHVTRSVDAVTKSTTAIVAPGTNLIRVTVHDRDPVVAKSLADAVASAFVDDTKTFAPLIGSNGQPSEIAPTSVAQLAGLPGSPLTKHLARNMILGALAALLVGIAVILLLDYAGLSARTPRQMEEQLGLAVIGVVPRQPEIAALITGADDGFHDLLLAGDDG